ncbi:MAG: hypothetical protein ACKVZH_15520 [Blastocatellia bacterium]
MSYFACVFFSWPALLFIYGIMLAFVGLIVGGIAWIFSWISGVPSWKALCAEAVVLAFIALIFWPMGFDYESIFFVSMFGSGASLFLLVVNWLYRRAENSAESARMLKPYSFDLSDDSPVVE